MNKFLALLFLVALSAAGADSLPYHPLRQIGTNHYDLRPLYTWRANLWAKGAVADAAERVSAQAVSDAAFRRDLDRNATAAAANAANARSRKVSAEYQAAKQACPLPAWVVPGAFTVEAVWTGSLLLLTCQEGQIVLKNHPNHDRVVDGQAVLFYALRSGNHQWTDRAGHIHTVPLYDYGIPYAPTVKPKP